MSVAFLAFSGTPGSDDFISSQIKHAISMSAAIEFFQNNSEASSCTVARIPASTKNLDNEHHIWDDIREDAVDLEELERSKLIDTIKSGRFHNAHEQQRITAIEKSYNDVMRFKGRAIYYALLILFAVIAPTFLPAGYLEIYLYPIIVIYGIWIAFSYYMVHLGCKGWAREFNPPAEDAHTLIETLNG